jgi:hypothetical protein
MEPRNVQAVLPHRVSIREVGPRDGFQNEPEILPTAVKAGASGNIASEDLVSMLGARGDGDR